MSHTISLVALAPLIQFVLFGVPIILIVRWAAKLPEGRLKRFLFWKDSTGLVTFAVTGLLFYLMLHFYKV